MVKTYRSEEVLQLLPSSLSFAGQTARVLPERLLPAFLCLALPLFLPILPLHSPSTIWTDNRNGFSSSTVIATSLQDTKASNFNTGTVFPSGLGTSLRVTEQQLHGVNYNRGSASSKGPTGGGQRHWRLKKKKRQRHRHAHHWQQLTRAQFPGGQFPAKFGCPPIKLEPYPLVHTYPANYVRVHSRLLGVYKESRVAHRAIPVRVS